MLKWTSCPFFSSIPLHFSIIYSILFMSSLMFILVSFMGRNNLHQLHYHVYIQRRLNKFIAGFHLLHNSLFNFKDVRNHAQRFLSQANYNNITFLYLPPAHLLVVQIQRHLFRYKGGKKALVVSVILYERLHNA